MAVRKQRGKIEITFTPQQCVSYMSDEQVMVTSEMEPGNILSEPPPLTGEGGCNMFLKGWAFISHSPVL